MITLAAAGIGAEAEADSIFGPATKAAVVAFQRRELTPDGIVGPATRSRLGLD